MRYLYRPALLCFLLWNGDTYAQTRSIDSLRAVLAAHPQADTFRVRRLNRLGAELLDTDKNAAVIFNREALQIARRRAYPLGEANALACIGIYHSLRGESDQARTFLFPARQIYVRIGDRIGEFKCLARIARTFEDQGNYAQAVAYGLQGLAIAETLHNKLYLMRAYHRIGTTYSFLGEYAKGRTSLWSSLKLASELHDQEGIALSWSLLGESYRLEKRWVENRRYTERARTIFKAIGDEQSANTEESNLANVAERQGRYQDALGLAHICLKRTTQLEDLSLLSYVQNILARTYLHTNHPDSAISFGLQSLKNSLLYKTKEEGLAATEVLAEAYAKQQNFPLAYRYQRQYLTYKDSLNNQGTVRRVAALQYNYDLDKKQSQITLLTKNRELGRQRSKQQRQFLYAALAGVALLLVLALFLFRNNQAKHQANKRLNEQNEEIARQRSALETSLADLHATQTQLIQREKMASLGELTAGIAHEIQNPLNFVNNFSEVSTELVAELREEETKAHRDPELIRELLDDLSENIQKITHHGGRASSIVKGMLEHSRTSTGERQPTNLNALANEYLRLAYQGSRAKNKAFTCELATDFAPDLGLVNVVPQEIGRVLLNLYNNALYAVQQRQRTAPATYQPTVRVSTRFLASDRPNSPERATSSARSTGLGTRTGTGPGSGNGNGTGHVEIRISDNGTGISEAVKAKIFQPFFTTKPTGEGTGLGLSLSYDIITKGHGGTLTVESREGDSATFTVILPI